MSAVQAIERRSAVPIEDEIMFVRMKRGVLNHRVRAVEYRNPCNSPHDHRDGNLECWLYWTWCHTAAWHYFDEGDDSHVCWICEQQATAAGHPSSGRIPMKACDVTNGQRWCPETEQWVL